MRKAHAPIKRLADRVDRWCCRADPDLATVTPGKEGFSILHPEEILADNFALLVNGEKDVVPSPAVVERLRTALKKGAR
jgi:hypothetical protein